MSLEWNQFSRLRNRLQRALQDNLVIPHTIVIILGNGMDLEGNLLKSKKALNKALYWLFSELKALIHLRREQFPFRARPLQDTRFLIVRQLPKPLGNTDDNFKANRRKFNDAVQKMALKLEMSMLEANDITSTSNDTIFTRQNKLSPAGFKIFWRSIDKAITLLDKDKAQKDLGITDSKAVKGNSELSKASTQVFTDTDQAPSSDISPAGSERQNQQPHRGRKTFYRGRGTFHYGRAQRGFYHRGFYNRGRGFIYYRNNQY